MVSAIRVMLTNVRYTGCIRWNTSEWRKDPDTDKRLRYERPRSEWQEHQDNELRIVTSAVYARLRSASVATPTFDSSPAASRSIC